MCPEAPGDRPRAHGCSGRRADVSAPWQDQTRHVPRRSAHPLQVLAGLQQGLRYRAPVLVGAAQGPAGARHRRLHPPRLGGGAEGDPGAGRARPVPDPPRPGETARPRHPGQLRGDGQVHALGGDLDHLPRDDRTRKVHHLLYAPGFDEADRITAALARIGNLASDGRPILGLDSRDLLDITLSAGRRLLPGARARLDAVVRRARLEVRLRRGSRTATPIWPITSSRWRPACPRTRR